MKLISLTFLNPEYYLDEFISQDYDLLRHHCPLITIYADGADKVSTSTFPTQSTCTFTGSLHQTLASTSTCTFTDSPPHATQTLERQLACAHTDLCRLYGGPNSSVDVSPWVAPFLGSGQLCPDILHLPVRDTSVFDPSYVQKNLHGAREHAFYVNTPLT